MAAFDFVIPAQAGIHLRIRHADGSRLRGDDELR